MSEDIKLDQKDSIHGSKLTYKTVSQNIVESFRTVRNFYSVHHKVVTHTIDLVDEDNVERVSLVDKPSPSRIEYLNQVGQLGFWTTLFTYIKVNIVAGFLFLPSGFKNGGWLFSLGVVFFIGMLSAYCNIALSECTEVANTYSFSKIGKKAMGKFGFYVVEIGIALTQICFPCSYGNLITQIMSRILKVWMGTEDFEIIYIPIVLAIIVVPMCLVRDISKFASFHFIGDVAVLLTIITLAYESSSNLSTGAEISSLPLIASGWAKVMGMTATTLEGIGVVLPIKENLKEKKQYNRVIFASNIIISVILMFFPLVMYFAFQDKVSEVVLNNLPMDQIYIQIVMIMLIFSVVIVYPSQLYPAFKILEGLLFSGVENGKCKTLKENLLRIFISLGTIVVGVLSINRFDTMLSLVGSGIVTPIAFIFPSIFHYFLFKDTQSTFRNLCDISVTVLGTAMSLTVLVFTII